MPFVEDAPRETQYGVKEVALVNGWLTLYVRMQFDAIRDEITMSLRLETSSRVREFLVLVPNEEVWSGSARYTTNASGFRISKL